MVIPGGSTDAEPSSEELAALVEVIRETGTPALFSNTAVMSSLVDAVAAEVGEVAVVPLHVGSVGPEGSGAETYAAMMVTNATLIADALLMDWFLEPFALGFQQRALLGGLIAAVMASMVGVWLVLRGMSFFGDAFVHGVLPGIAAAVVLDFSPYLGAAIAAVFMVAGIEYVHRTTTLKEDTGIGLLFVGMLALGVVIISKSTSYSGSLTSILFGDAFGVTTADLVGQAVLAAVVVLGTLALYGPSSSSRSPPRRRRRWGCVRSSYTPCCWCSSRWRSSGVSSRSARCWSSACSSARPPPRPSSRGPSPG